MEILGWIANLLFFVGGAFKNPRKTIAFCMTGDVLYVALYASLDLYLGAIAMGIAAIRSAFALTLDDKGNLYALIILTGLLCLLMLFNANNLFDLALLFANIAIGLSTYYRAQFVKFRILVSISQILWIIHSLVFGVYSMLFCSSVILCINIAALLYYSPYGEAITSRFMQRVKA